MPNKLISKSGLETLARCPRLYKHTYIDVKERIYELDLPLKFGLMFHDGVEQYWHHLGKSNQIEAMLAVLDDYEFEPTDKLFAQTLLVCYADEWCGASLEVIGTEIEAIVPSGVLADVGLVARFDALVRSRDMVLVVETKTTRTDITRDYYWERLDLDMQIGLYVWMAQQMGHDCKSVIYDVTRVPRLRFGKDGRKQIDETRAEFKERVIKEVNRNRSNYFRRQLFTPNLETVMSNVTGWLKTLDFHENHQVWPMSHMRCFDYGRVCGFKPVCTGETTVNNTKMYRKREKR